MCRILGEKGPAVCDFFDPDAAGVARRSLDGNVWNESKLEVRYTYELSPEERQPCEAQVSTEGNMMVVSYAWGHRLAEWHP